MKAINLTPEQDLQVKELLKSYLSPSKEYTVRYAKDTLKHIYELVGSDKKARSSDLRNYYNIVETVATIDKKTVRFIHILSSI